MFILVALSIEMTSPETSACAELIFDILRMNSVVWHHFNMLFVITAAVWDKHHVLLVVLDEDFSTIISAIFLLWMELEVFVSKPSLNNTPMV